MLKKSIYLSIHLSKNLFLSRRGRRWGHGGGVPRRTPWQWSALSWAIHGSPRNRLFSNIEFSHCDPLKWSDFSLDETLLTGSYDGLKVLSLDERLHFGSHNRLKVFSLHKTLLLRSQNQRKVFSLDKTIVPRSHYDQKVLSSDVRLLIGSHDRRKVLSLDKTIP